MKYVMSAWLWFIGILTFCIVVIIGNIALTFAKPKTIYSWYTKLFRIIFKVLLVKVKVEFQEPLDKSKAYLIMPNHVSFLDAPLFSGYPPCFILGIEADSHFRWPIYGRLLRKWGNIPIVRSSVTASLQSLGKAKEKLEEGYSILIFPEGHRTVDGHLQNFKKLPFLLAKQSGVGILPVGISGVYHLNKKGSFIVNPTTIKIKYGKPISAEIVEQLPINELVDFTKNQISALIERP